MKKFLSICILLIINVLCINAQEIADRIPRHRGIFNTRLCSVISVTDAIPWLDDFSTEPECWTFPMNNNTSWEWDNVDDYIYHDFGTYEGDAISPILDISNVSTPYLKFSQKRADFASSTVCDELYVYYRSTATGGDSTWYLLGTYTDVCNDWFIDSIALPQNLTTIQIKFHAIGNGSLADGVSLGFVNVYNEENAPSCIAPTALNVFNIGEYSAELSWALASGGSVDLYYRVISDSIYNLIENVSLTNGIYLLDNLETATQYVWYLDLDCSGEHAETTLHHFTTGCGLISAPYYENFEFVNPGNNPPCWNTLNSVTEGAYHFPGVGNIINQYTHSGSHSYKFRNNSDPQFAFLPEFDNVFSTLQLNFWTRREGFDSGTFSVGYATDSLTANSFVPLLTISGSDLGDNSYHNYTIRYDSVATVANSHYYIAFKYECSAQWFWYIDDISVTEIIPCITPDSLNASNVTGTSVNLSWSGNADNYTVYYRVVGATNYEQIDNVTLNANGVYTLTGLTPSTNYEWYVEAYCSDGSIVQSFITEHFTTECGTISTFPTSWDFEANNTAGTTDNPLPTCWTRVSSSTSTSYPYVYHQSSNAHSGSESLRFYNRYSNSIAVLPAVDNAQLTNLQISFYAKVTYTNAATTMEVGVMTDPDDATTFTTISSITPNDTYTLYEIPFSTYTGSGNYIAIRNVAPTTTPYQYSYSHIDDITLSSIAGCTAPINLTAEPSTYSAMLSWVSSATTFTLYYKEANDNTWQSVSNVSLNSNNEYELIGLIEGTAYDWYVETSCGVTPELTSVHAYFTTIMEPVNLPYQTDFSDNYGWLMNNGHAGNYWTIATPDGHTQPALFITSNGTSAEYNTTLNAVVTAEKAFNMPEGNSVHVEFDVQVGGEGGSTPTPSDYLKVFLAPNTTIYTTGATSSNAQSAYDYETYAFNFSDYLWQTLEYNYPYKLNMTQDSILHISMNVTNPAVIGEAKIVFLWKNDDYIGTQPSAIIRNFFITDDTTYTPPTPPTPLTCNVPTNVNIANISPYTADVSWTAGSDASAWNIQYKESDATSWGSSIHTTSTYYHLSGLNPETTYQVRVQADCIDTLSDWTAAVSFTTEEEEVGIDNFNLAQSIKLMPNPADNYIELHVNSNVEMTEALVYNAFGQLIQTVQLNDNHAHIDLSDMATGMYFVRVNGEGVTATKKFIKR